MNDRTTPPPVSPTGWENWMRCPVCRAEVGEPCVETVTGSVRAWAHPSREVDPDSGPFLGPDRDTPATAVPLIAVQLSMEENGASNEGQVLTTVRLPAVPRPGDEVFVLRNGDTHRWFRVTGPAVFTDGSPQVDVQAREYNP